MDGNREGTDVVLLVGTYRPAIGAARALARRGRRVIAGVGPDSENTEGSAGIRWSRHVADVFRHAAWTDPDRFMADLAREIERHPGVVAVLPCYEPVLVLLSRERHRLPARARLVAPRAETVETCIDKGRCLDAARNAGLPSVPHEEVHDMAALERAVQRLGGAVAVKPMAPQSRIGRHKAIVAGSMAAVHAALPAWPTGHARLLVQRRISGHRVNLHFVARAGQLLASVESIAVRTDRLDGTGLTLELHTQAVTPRVRELVARFVASLGYDGIGLAQFMVDDVTGEAYLIELNPRLGALSIYADRAGVDLASLGVDIALGRPVTPRPDGRAGVRAVWTTGDLIAAWRGGTHGELTRRGQVRWLRGALVAALRADVHTVWSWRDPLPAAATLLQLLRRVATPVRGSGAGRPR